MSSCCRFQSETSVSRVETNPRVNCSMYYVQQEIRETFFLSFSQDAALLYRYLRLGLIKWCWPNLAKVIFIIGIANWNMLESLRNDIRYLVVHLRQQSSLDSKRVCSHDIQLSMFPNRWTQLNISYLFAQS